MRRALLVASLIAAVASALGCASLLREPVTPFPRGTPASAPWQLNRELLEPRPGRIVFVVDVVDGHPPERAALDDLVALASRYGERPALWMKSGRDAPLIADGGPESMRLRRNDESLRAEDSYVMVRYVGAAIPLWGQSWQMRVAGKTVYVICINQERHRRFRSERLSERRLEEQTLIHEYGHLLGLPTSDHGYFPHYPDETDGAHCINPTCALSKPRLRSLLYALINTGLFGHFLEDYCPDCQRTIREAKAYWAHAHAASPFLRPFARCAPLPVDKELTAFAGLEYP